MPVPPDFDWQNATWPEPTDEEIDAGDKLPPARNNDDFGRLGPLFSVGRNGDGTVICGRDRLRARWDVVHKLETGELHFFVDQCGISRAPTWGAQIAICLAGPMGFECIDDAWVFGSWKPVSFRDKSLRDIAKLCKWSPGGGGPSGG